MRAAGHVFDLVPNEVIWIAAHCDDVDILMYVDDIWKFTANVSLYHCIMKKVIMIYPGFSNEHLVLPSSSLLRCVPWVCVYPRPNSQTHRSLTWNPNRSAGKGWIFWKPSFSDSILSFPWAIFRPYPLMVSKRTHWVMVRKPNGWLMLRYLMLGGWANIRAGLEGGRWTSHNFRGVFFL